MSSRRATARQRTLRAALRNNHMRPIAEVAKQKLRDVPELAHAAAMADAAKAHEQVFKDVGLPDDFISSLDQIATEVSKSIDDRKQHSSKRNGATAIKELASSQSTLEDVVSWTSSV